MENPARLETVNEPTLGKQKEYSHEDLKGFTNGFNDEIGVGTFGNVYKGQFPDGVQIAVKVLIEQYVTKELFMEEVRIMGMARHPNLVELYGFCFDSNIKGLVYEYAENGSLDMILGEKDLCHRVGWDKFYDIMTESAIAISYLHDENIIHYDIKPSNVLLTSSFSPKIADFGLAKLISKDATHVTLIEAIGTRGYMAPEMWKSYAHVTNKCDIYSFGMMLFDILGMSSINQYEEWFLNIVWEGYQNRQIDKIMEDCGIEEKDKKSAKRLVMVGFWCSQHTPSTRPPMSKIVKMLKREIPIRMPPNPNLPSTDFIPEPLLEMEGNEIVKAIRPQSNTTDEAVNIFKREIPIRMPPNPNLPSTDFIPEPSLEMEGNEVVKAIRPQSSTTDEAVNIFIRYVDKDSGASPHKPVAAIVIYKCLLHWNSFQEKQAIIFDALVQMIDSAIANWRGTRGLAYWLSNTSMLLLFLSYGFKDKRAIRQKAGLLPVCFTDQITAYVDQISNVILNHMKKELESLLSGLTKPKASSESSSNLFRTTQWQNLIAILNKYHRQLQKHFVPSVLIQDIFSQTFYFINVHLFNSLMLHPECCSYSNAKYLEAGLRRLELWCDQATRKYAGSSWDELHHVRVAIRLLVMHNKSTISTRDIRNICPRLYRKQFYTLCTNCSDDKNDTRRVSDDVISQMKIFLSKASQHDAPDSFLLEDKPNTLFNSLELFNSLREVDFSDDTLNAERIKNPALKALLEW